MFDNKSRYAELDDRSYIDGNGRAVLYKSRRLLSRAEDRPVLTEVTVFPSDRPDLVAARTIGRPELFWRVCDANGVMNPFELTERAGRTVRILMPGV